MSTTGFTVCLFPHTDQGTAALDDLLEAGIGHDAIHVIGDLGLPMGSAGAEHHVTFDRLHLPAEDRTQVMDTIRDGGVVLATDASVVDSDFTVEIAERHRVLRVFHTTPGAVNPSHNPAR